MSAFGEGVNEYLALRRSLGYKLEAHGRLLPQFAEFLQLRDATVITTALALEWATEPAEGSVVWWHQRLAIAAGFARYLQASDPRHEVPAADLLPAKFRRAIPYLYRGGDRGADAGSSQKSIGAQGRDLRDADRAAVRDRHADRRGGRA